MPPQIASATPPDALGPFLAMVALGAFHGLNPGMGWLFALSLGLQQRSERAIWRALVPITAGHFASIAGVALLVVLGAQVISTVVLDVVAASVLIAFGLYKLFRYYRHPRWVGMKVGGRDLFVWSFLMATAHGAGLMIAPFLVTLADPHAAHAGPHAGHVEGIQGGALLAAVALHMASMLVVMGAVAWVVYKKAGLAVLRRGWVNFDLIWAIALVTVGLIALAVALF